MKNQTWTLIGPQPDMHIMDHKWVYKIKLNVDQSLQKLKARLIAKVFQQILGIDYLETFSL